MLTLLRDLNDDPARRHCSQTYLTPDARRVAQRILGAAYCAAAMFDPCKHVGLNVAIGIDTGIRALALNQPSAVGGRDR